MADKSRHLLAGYAAEILDRDERRELMEAAIADQDVFDRLVEEESWRRVLSSPGVRREILEALEGPKPLAGVLGWIRRPAVRWAVASAAAALLAVIVVPSWRDSEKPPDGGEELVAKGITEELTSKVPAEAVRELSYGLELWTEAAPRPVTGDYEWQSGDEFRIRLEADFPAWVYLFNRAEGEDAYTVVYPASETEHAASEGEIVVPPGDREWLGMDETPEDESLVLVVGTAPWPAFEAGRRTFGREELEDALAAAERDLESASWRRSVEGDRVRFRIADPDGELYVIERLFAE